MLKVGRPLMIQSADLHVHVHSISEHTTGHIRKNKMSYTPGRGGRGQDWMLKVGRPLVVQSADLHVYVHSLSTAYTYTRLAIYVHTTGYIRLAGKGADMIGC